MKKSKILMVIVTTILMMSLLVSNVFALSPNQINAASNVNGTNEVSIIDKSINVLNDLYWNNDILHNTWIKFTK